MFVVCFSNLCIPPCVGKTFKIYCVRIPRKCIESRHFYSYPLPTQNSRQNFLKICFPQQKKGMEKTTLCFIKIQSENMKMFGASGYLYFVQLAIFSKCMMALHIFSNIYPVSYRVVLSLLPLYCNQDNLTLKLHQKK